MNKITIKDIVQKSGFSLKTVSRVINNEKYVNESTRAKILKIIEELNFEPDYFAKNLKTKKTKTIGLILGDIENPYYSNLAKGVIDFFELKGYTTMLCNTNYDSTLCERYINVLVSKKVDGIILMNLKVRDHILEKIILKKIPIVLVQADYDKFPNLNCVNFDNYQAEVLATEYLINLGHKKIFYLVGPKVSSAELRVQAFLNTLKKHNIYFNDSYLSENLIGFDDSYKATVKMLKSKKGFTAIIAVNDFIALGSMKAIYEMGLEIPKDISLIGFDDIKFSSVARVSLTTISEPDYDLGKLSAERLFKMLENPESTNKPKRVILRQRLIVRDSCRSIK